jgi:hypothetical protein
MHRHLSFATLDVVLRLRPPTGPALPVTLVELELERHDEDPVECRATFQLERDEYLRAEREGLFHLSPEVRGPGAAGFRPDGPVTVEARLGDDQLQGLEAAGTDMYTVGQLLVTHADEGTDDPMLSTEAWWATSVLRTLDPPAELGPGQLQTGYRTQHARIHAAEP